MEMVRRPFIIDAIVIMPDHIHSVWSLPKNDANYSMRWHNIKRIFTESIQTELRPFVFLISEVFKPKLVFVRISITHSRGLLKELTNQVCI